MSEVRSQICSTHEFYAPARYIFERIKDGNNSQNETGGSLAFVAGCIFSFPWRRALRVRPAADCAAFGQAADFELLRQELSVAVDGIRGLDKRTHFTNEGHVAHRSRQNFHLRCKDGQYTRSSCYATKPHVIGRARNSSKLPSPCYPEPTSWRNSAICGRRKSAFNFVFTILRYCISVFN